MPIVCRVAPPYRGLEGVVDIWATAAARVEPNTSA